MGIADVNPLMPAHSTACEGWQILDAGCVPDHMTLLSLRE